MRGFAGSISAAHCAVCRNILQRSHLFELYGRWMLIVPLNQCAVGEKDRHGKRVTG